MRQDTSPTKIDFERGMNVMPPVTTLLITANALIFGFTLFRGFLVSPESITAAGALVRSRVLDGEVWCLATSMFLHGGIDHLFGNCVGLYILGMATEQAFGLSRTAIVYFAAGLAGASASVVMSPGPSVGASGAIFGLLGAVIAFFFKHGNHFHVRDKVIGNVLLLWAGYSVVAAFFEPYIDNAAHVGGLVAGAAAGLVLTPRYLASAKSA